MKEAIRMAAEINPKKALGLFDLVVVLGNFALLP
jgi:hypothetical protein